jgi:hypothetical protein
LLELSELLEVFSMASEMGGRNDLSVHRLSQTPLLAFAVAVLRASSRLPELLVYTRIEVDALHSIRTDVVTTVLTCNGL